MKKWWKKKKKSQPKGRRRKKRARLGRVATCQDCGTSIPIGVAGVPKMCPFCQGSNVTRPSQRPRPAEERPRSVKEGPRRRHKERCAKGYPAEWTEALRESIRERQHRRCAWCGLRENDNGEKLAVHHRNGRRKDCRDENLVALCKPCHTLLAHEGKHSTLAGRRLAASVKKQQRRCDAWRRQLEDPDFDAEAAFNDAEIELETRRMMRGDPCAWLRIA